MSIIQLILNKDNKAAVTSQLLHFKLNTCQATTDTSQCSGSVYLACDPKIACLV